MTETTPATEPAVEAAPAESLLTPAGFGDWRDEVPAKFMRDGEVDHANLVKSYTHLETRLGSGDAPPQEASAYEFKAPEGVAVDDAMKAMIDDHKARAHELGLSQSQFEEYTADLFELAGELQSEFAQTPEKAEAALKGVWADKYDENLALAQKAYQRYGKDLDIAKVGNNPEALMVLAAVGRDLGESRNPPNGVPVRESLAQLRADPDYLNPHSPRYQILQNKVLELTRQGM